MADLTANCTFVYNFTLSEPAAYSALYNSAEQAITAIVIPIITFLGLFANLTFIFSVARVPSIRSMTINYYLVTLALIDTAVLIVSFLYFVWPYATSEVSWAVPFKRCWLIFGIILTTLQASNFLVTVIAIERYFCVCQPLKYRNLSKKHIFSIIAAVLFLGLVFGILTTPALGNNLKACILWPVTDKYNDKETSYFEVCIPYEFIFAAFPWIVIFNDIPFYIGLVLNFVLYAAIVSRLSSRRSMSTTQDTDKLRNQVARMLVVNGTVFFLCQIPSRIWNLGRAIDPTWPYSPDSSKVILLVIRIVLVFNSAVNPFIYGMMSPHYRKGVQKAFRRTIKEQRRKPSEPVSDTGTDSQQKTQSTTALTTI